MGVELASHVEVAFSLFVVAEVEGDGAGVVPSCPFRAIVFGSPFVVFEFSFVVVVDVCGVHKFVEGEFGWVEGSLFSQFGVGFAGFRVVESNLGAAEVGEDLGVELSVGFGRVFDHLLALDKVLLSFDDVDDGVFVLDVRFFDHDDEMDPVFAGGASGDDDLFHQFVFVVVDLVGGDIFAFSHGVEDVVEDAFDLSSSHFGAVFADADIVGFLAFG